MSPLRADRGARATNPVTVVDMVATRQTPSCRFRYAKCHHCGKTGHIVRVCRAKQAQHPLETPTAANQFLEEANLQHGLEGDRSVRNTRINYVSFTKP